MDQDDEIAAAAAAYIVLSAKKKKRKHKCWVKPSLCDRSEYGGMHLLNVLKKDDVYIGNNKNNGSVKNFLRMSSTDFEWLLCQIAPKIQKEDTNYRQAISPMERLLLTLRFLATGDSYHSLMYLFKISVSSISRIIPEVCKVIAEVLKDKLKMPQSREEWLITGHQFANLWNFPKCAGVMDGKHIMIQAPKHSGSEFYNYKSFFSVVLFIVANANYEVMYLNVGSQGCISDGGVFDSTHFKKMLYQNTLNLPELEPLPGRTKAVPFVFLGDDAFPLSPNLLKPYPGTQEKGSSKRIFNYRLSRARRISEMVFGIMSARFRVLRKPMLLEPDRVELVVAACVYLHNFLRSSLHSRKSYSPPGTFDSEDKDTGERIPGSWRNEINNNMFASLQKQARNSTLEAKQVRDEFAQYFMSPEGMVPWQNNF
ncbi:uncharacterized protein LOC126884296 [Diabrotica virgifera virgifera]|uniref:DDE Tnp4 domain-containing protein n=1 Tax=Diabrotica virgifera virgifera TaxID=50390 RepID=A0ABM5K7N0_DIAVI|nr:uncharacterized protein LOC126884296 [Diabrotica virgifera virgifera]